jgi:hypothetical protein
MTNSTKSHLSGFITPSGPPDPPGLPRGTIGSIRLGSLFLMLPTRGLKPKSAAEEKDNDMEARLKAMTREERLAYAWELLEGAKKYLPADEREGETIEGDSAEVEADD